MSIAALLALRYCFTEYQKGPSGLAQFFRECEDERRWIGAHNELAKVDSALALELEYDHKTAIRHYV